MEFTGKAWECLILYAKIKNQASQINQLIDKINRDPSDLSLLAGLGDQMNDLRLLMEDYAQNGCNEVLQSKGIPIH